MQSNTRDYSRLSRLFKTAISQINYFCLIPFRGYKAWRKMCWLNKQKLVAMVTSLEPAQLYSTAIIYARKDAKPENFAKIGRVRTFWNNWPWTSSKNRKQFRQFALSMVNEDGAIRQITYDFLFDFQSNYMAISCRFGDISRRKKMWIQWTINFVAMATSLEGSKKITSCRSSTAKVLPIQQISWRSVRQMLR